MDGRAHTYIRKADNPGMPSGTDAKHLRRGLSRASPQAITRKCFGSLPLAGRLCLQPGILSGEAVGQPGSMEKAEMRTCCWDTSPHSGEPGIRPSTPIKWTYGHTFNRSPDFPQNYVSFNFWKTLSLESTKSRCTFSSE